MRSNSAFILPALIIAIALGANSNAASAQGEKPTACTLITAPEMTEILGVAVTSEADDRTGQTQCMYSSGEDFGPYAEIQLSWGDGEAGMAGADMAAGQLSPDVVSPYDGLGDQATSVGPMLLIRRGEDLIEMVFSGIDDMPGTAKRVYELLDERLPKSSPIEAPGVDGGQSAVAEPGTPEPASPVTGVLDGLIEQLKKADGGQLGTLDCPPSQSGQQGAPKPFGDPAASVIPLIDGLTITTARSEAQGDYELLFTVQAVSPDGYTITSSAELAGEPGAATRELTVARKISLADHRTARCVRAHFRKGDPEVFSGTTVFFSSAVLTGLRQTGEAAITLVGANSFYGLNFEEMISGTLARIEPATVLLPVLVNGRETELPAIHAKVEAHDMYVLDDPENPIVLRAERANGSAESFRVVRIDFPVPSTAATSIERSLAEDREAVVHGIYFASASARIRPESERVLQEIADALRSNPDWQLRIDGHTDNIGDDDANLQLSRERANAVKAALLERYGITADRITSAGHGEQSPKAANDTPEGRARNRRVELIRL